MQHGEDRGQPGGDPRRRHVAACGGQDPAGTLDPADDDPSFTLGVVNVSPMSMAAAYAVPASNGVYCKPIVLTKIVDDDGPVAAGAVGGMPPGDPRPGRAGRELHPPGRAQLPNGTAAGNGARELPGGGQDRHLQRGERQRHAVTPRSPGTPPPWPATSRCSTRPRRRRTR